MSQTQQSHTRAADITGEHMRFHAAISTMLGTQCWVSVALGWTPRPDTWHTDTRHTGTRHGHTAQTRGTDTRLTDTRLTDTRLTDTRLTDTRLTNTRLTNTRESFYDDLL